MSNDSFTNQKPRFATVADTKAQWGCDKAGKRFRCYLCGHKFLVGDIWRWVYAGPGYMNFLTCEGCDGEDVLERWKQHVDISKEKYWWLWD